MIIDYGMSTAPFFVIARSLSWKPPEIVIKVPFKTNIFFNSTMMALFLPVGSIVSKKNKQQRKLCLLLQCLTNSNKS